MTLRHRTCAAARILVAFSLLVTCTGSLAAQNARTTIRGVVRSLAGPVAGANVFVLEGGRMQMELLDGSKIAASRARSRDLRNRTI